LVSQKSKEPEARDEVDQQITRSLRAARRASARAVPTASSSDPADDLLLRVIDGTASADDRKRVEEGGPFTRDRLEILREALKETSPSLLQSATRYVFAVARDTMTFLRGATAPLAAPQLAWATRGSASSAESFLEFKQDFADLEAQVRVEHVVRPKADPTLDVQVRLVASSGAPASSSRVTIRRAGRTIDSIPTESDGSATFTGLQPDRYELELRSTGQVIGVMLLDFLPA
jgi:hypothetical protein